MVWARTALTFGAANIVVTIGYVTWSSMMSGGSPIHWVWMITSTSEMSGSASSGIRSSDQTPASTTLTRKEATRKRLLLHQSMVPAIMVSPRYIPPVADMLSCLVAICLPARVATTVTFHVPPLSRLIGAEYAPSPTGLAVASTRIAAMPIAGIAGMKKTTETSAFVTGLPDELRTVTSTSLLPLWGGLGLVVISMLPDGALFTALAPGGGGAKVPSAACNWLSESIRKLAELTMRAPARRPLRTTNSRPACAPSSTSTGCR